MPFRLRRYRSRYGSSRRVGLFRRRRLFRTRFRRVPRLMGGMSRPLVHFFTRKSTLTPITVPNTSVTGYKGGGLQWQLSDVPNASEFTALYDQFKILKIKTYIVMRANVNSLNDSAGNNNIGMPNIICAEDLDDVTAPSDNLAGYQVVQQYARSKAMSFTPEKRVFRFTVVPAVSTQIFESGVSTAYSPKRLQWISTNDPTTPHYGMKYVIEVPISGGTVGVDVAFDVYATYKLLFRSVK